MAKKLRRRSRRKLWVTTGVVLILLLVVAGVYYASHAPKTSKQPTATYQPPSPSSSAVAAGQSGAIVDQSTSNASPTPTPVATQSPTAGATGVIALTSPANGGKILNGSTVSGTAGNGLSQVQYRIKDTVHGVIAAGDLTVTNGSFAGTVNGLTPGSDTGTLEVYNYGVTGAEENNVKVNVSFK